MLTVGLFSFSNEKEYVTIGAILPLTGTNANYGIPEREGISLAVNNINQSGILGEKELRVIFEDSKADPKESVSEINKLINLDNVDFIISSLTNVTDSIAPIAMDNNKILYYFSTDARIAREQKYAFRDYFDHSVSCRLAAEFAKQKNITSVGFLSYDRSSGKICFDSFKEEFEKDKNRVAYNEIYPPTETDFRSYVLKLKNKNVEMIFINDYAAKIPTIIVQTDPIFTPEYYFILMGEDPVANTDATKQIYSKTNVFGVYPSIDFKDNPITVKFISDYEERYGSLPTHDVIYAYDGVNALIDSYLKCEQKIDVGCIASQLENTTFYGVIENFDFDENRNSIRKIGIINFENGVWRRYN